MSAAGEERDSERVPYHRYAFANVYNYTLLGGVLSAAALTGQWWLLIFGGAAEALWMLFAPDSRLLQRSWFDRIHAERQRDAMQRELKQELALLPAAQSQRVLSLGDKREQILRLAKDNQAFTNALMSGELNKLEELVGDFAGLAVAAHRYDTYLDSTDVKALASDLKRYETLVRDESDPERRSLAQKNLDVLMQRREKLAELRQFVGRARAQMDLIENTFELLADQIVTMRSPRELNGQLDDLIDGVEAVRTTARETEALLEGVAR
jgi:hypothetical protein